MHAIDYTLLRQLVPHYRARSGNTRGSVQEQILVMLGVYLEPTLDR